MTNHDHDRVLSVRYTNWRGETSMRLITPVRTFWGSNKYHAQPQWLMDVYDHEKMAMRTYALAECDFTASEDRAG